MQRSSLGVSSALVISLVAMLAVAPSFAAGPTYATTALAPHGLAWVQIGGFPGVSINYTNTGSSQFQGVVYVDVVNAAGQTVAVSDGAASLASGQTVDCYVPVIGLPSGTFTAIVFIVTTTSIPVSVTSTLHFTT